MDRYTHIMKLHFAASHHVAAIIQAKDQLTSCNILFLLGDPRHCGGITVTLQATIFLTPK